MKNNILILFLIVFLVVMLSGCDEKEPQPQPTSSTTVITSNIHKIYFDVADRECKQASEEELSYISYVSDSAHPTEKNTQITTLRFTCADGSSWEYKFTYDLEF